MCEVSSLPNPFYSTVPVPKQVHTRYNTVKNAKGSQISINRQQDQQDHFKGLGTSLWHRSRNFGSNNGIGRNNTQGNLKVSTKLLNECQRLWSNVDPIPNISLHRFPTCPLHTRDVLVRKCTRKMPTCSYESGARQRQP